MSQSQGIKRKRALFLLDDEGNCPEGKGNQIIRNTETKKNSCPIKSLSKDEWGLIISFLELGHGKDIESNLPLLLSCRRISELLDWKLVLRNIRFAEEFHENDRPVSRGGLLLRIENIVRNLYLKKDIGREVIEVILSNEGVCPAMLRHMFIASMNVNEFRWDWETALKTCIFPKSQGYRRIQFLYALKILFKHPGRRIGVNALLENTSCTQAFRQDLLTIVVDDNFPDLVPKVFANNDPSYFDGVKPLLLFSRSLILEREEISAMIQNDDRVKDRIVPCSLCDENPCCIYFCMNWPEGKCVGSPGELPMQFCKPCQRDYICMICNEHMCQGCRDAGVKDIQYGQCTTCEKIVCCNGEAKDESGICSVQCANYEICGKVSCRDCMYRVTDDWKQVKKWGRCENDKKSETSLRHWFCSDCSPSNVNYQVGEKQSENDSIIGCIACRNANLRKCLTCALVERNTVENSEGWYHCPINSEHMFCSGCTPSHGDETISSECPACKCSN